MTSETYYPEQRHLVAKTTIRRERLLPDNSSGEVIVQSGARVSLEQTVARGVVPSPYVLLDAMRYFRLKNPDQLNDLLQVQISESVMIDEVLAKRGRRELLSPVTGTVIDIEQGRIILQEMSPIEEVEAGLSGSVISVRKGRGVVIEAYGAVLQGVWGNGRRRTGVIRVEPAAGMENIFGDVIDTQFRGQLVVTRRTLKKISFQVIEDQSFGGVIAPSMEPDLIHMALKCRAAIMLTEGFGSQRLSNTISTFLDEMEGRQGTLDAVLPAAYESRRPEVILNVPIDPGDRPNSPSVNAAAQIGREVRLTRGDSAGMMGRVIGLPKDPVVLDNGLRVPCVQVELVTGEKVTVPLANIEVSGT
jgi:hypothetical protein